MLQTQELKNMEDRKCARQLKKIYKKVVSFIPIRLPAKKIVITIQLLSKILQERKRVLSRSQGTSWRMAWDQRSPGYPNDSNYS